MRTVLCACLLVGVLASCSESGTPGQNTADSTGTTLDSAAGHVDSTAHAVADTTKEVLKRASQKLDSLFKKKR